MSIKIYTKKVVPAKGELAGKQCRKLIGFEMLHTGHLPDEYLQHPDAVWSETRSGLSSAKSGEGWGKIHGTPASACSRFVCLMDFHTVMSEEEFSEIIERIRRAALILSIVMNDVEEARKNWRGEETFVI